MRIGVTGAHGQLGRELCRQLGEDALPLTRVDLDLADLDSIAERLLTLRPAVVINAAAYTQVDRAEKEAELCHRVNAEAVLRVATACDRLACPLVQISSDYVFGQDSERNTPYRETDEAGPLSAYGNSKLAGEESAAQCKRVLTVRTCGLYASPEHSGVPTNFVSTMLRLANEKRSVRVVSDQRCSPSYAPHVAAAILALLDGGARGLWHVVNCGDVSWWEFAREAYRLAGLVTNVQPITTAEYGAAAPRPAYSVLTADKFSAALGQAMPEWQTALEEFFAARRGFRNGQ